MPMNLEHLALDLRNQRTSVSAGNAMLLEAADAIDALAHQRDELRHECARLGARVSGLESTLEGIRLDRDLLVGQRDELRRERDSYESDFNDLLAQKRDIENQREELLAALRRLAGDCYGTDLEATESHVNANVLLAKLGGGASS